jgi:hypothetical protein
MKTDQPQKPRACRAPNSFGSDGFISWWPLFVSGGGLSILRADMKLQSISIVGQSGC